MRGAALQGQREGEVRPANGTARPAERNRGAQTVNLECL